MEIELRIVKPVQELFHFVESFWMLINHAEKENEIVVLPDGRFDVFFSYTANEPYHVIMRGLDSAPGQNAIPPKTVMFAVSFKLLAIEYLLDIKAASLLNTACYLPVDFWGITAGDLDDFDGFCNKASAKMLTLIKEKIDARKQKLFELIYDSDGSMTVKELSERVYWTSRQINRYFNQQFGISLKAYCNILRFRASFAHIKEGRLFPEQNFSDQAHFIKEVRKLSGVAPKELLKNKNDRFLQFSTWPKK